LFLGLVGCGDSPNLALRDTMTFLNELNDYILQVPDDEHAEEVAGVFNKNPSILFKQRADLIKHRWELYRPTDKDAIRDIKEAGEFWKDELMALLSRSNGAVQRLDRIIDRLSEEEAQRQRGPKKHAIVGDPKKLENEIADFAARGETLVVIERSKVCPNLTDMLSKLHGIFQQFKGKGAAVEEEKK